MEITPSSTGKELEELATCIHELVGRLPLTIRSREKKRPQNRRRQSIRLQLHGTST